MHVFIYCTIFRFFISLFCLLLIIFVVVFVYCTFSVPSIVVMQDGYILISLTTVCFYRYISLIQKAFPTLPLAPRA